MISAPRATARLRDLISGVRRGRPRLTAFALALVLVLTACSQATSQDAAPSPPAPTPEQTQRHVAGDVPVQDMWLFADVRTVDGSGKETSVIDEMIDEARADADEPVPLAGLVSFAPTPGLSGAIVGADGSVRDGLEVTFGLFSVTDVPDGAAVPDDAVGEQTLGMVTTARGGTTNVSAGDVLRLDPGQFDALAKAETVLVDYGFGQALPLADPAEEAGLSPLETLAARWEGGQVRWQGREQDGQMGPALHVGVVGQTYDEEAGSDATATGDAQIQPALYRPGEASARLARDAGTVIGGALGIPIKEGMITNSSVLLAATCIAGGILIPGAGAVVVAVMCVGADAISTFSSVQQSINDNNPTPPTPPCTGLCGGSSGDPHLDTFDGHHYSPQAVGETVLVDGGDDMQIQARTAPMGSSRNVAVNTAVAIGASGHTVVVDAVADAPGTVQVDGTLTALDTHEQVGLDGGVSLVRTGNSVVVGWADGSNVVAAVSGDSLDFVVHLADARGGEVSGLLGNADGDPANDLTTADGRTLTDPTSDELYDVFVESWRVDDSANLFDAPLTHDRAFPAAQASLDDLEPDRRTWAETICRAAGLTEPSLRDCIIDVAISGDVRFATRATLAQGVHRPDAFDHAVLGGGPLAWTTRMDGREFVGEGGGTFATGDGYVLVQTRDTDDRSHLAAVDASDGTIRWETPDVEGNCRPVVTPSGRVVAQLAPQSAIAGEDHNADLVVLDPATGDIADRWEPADDADVLPGCKRVLTSTPSGLVLQAARSRVLAFAAEPRLAPVWSYEAEDAVYGLALAQDDEVFVIADDEEGVPTLRRLDAATGLEQARLRLPHRAWNKHTGAVVPLSGDRVAIADSYYATARSYLSVVRTSGDLEVVWSYEFGDDAELTSRFDQVASLGDVLVGWSKNPETGTGLGAIDADSGDFAWSYRTTSFDNSSALIEVIGDVAVVSPFHGAWLEAVGPDGKRAWIIDREDVTGIHGPFKLAAAGERLVLGGRVSKEAGGGVYVAAVDPERVPRPNPEATSD